MANLWRLKGSYFETCNCEAPCPCNFLGSPTDGNCTVLVGWHIDQGEFEGMGLGDLNVALVAHSPGHMLETQWKVALYIDDRATEGQRDALTRIFSGKAGGVMEHVAGFVGELAGVRSVPIEYRAEGRTRSIRIGEVGVADIEAIEGGGGGEALIHNPPFSLVPGEPLVVARSTAYRFADYGMQIAVSNKNGFYAPFDYAPA